MRFCYIIKKILIPSGGLLPQGDECLLLDCVCLSLSDSFSVLLACSYQFLWRITFLPSDGSSVWLCWHESSDTPMFSWAINLSQCLCICVFWQFKSSRCLMCPVPRHCANPGAPGAQWHCSARPIVCDPGSGGSSWWILQYQPAWHQHLARALIWKNTVPISTLIQTMEGSSGYSSTADQLFPHYQLCRFRYCALHGMLCSISL